MALPVIAIKGGSKALITAIKTLLAKNGFKTFAFGSTIAANEFIQNWKIRQSNRRDDRQSKNEKDDKVVVIVNNNNNRRSSKPNAKKKPSGANGYRPNRKY